MICYRDMTFCSGDGCAKFGPCHRSLTPEVQAKADAIGIPIAEFTEPKQMLCWEAPPEKKEPRCQE